MNASERTQSGGVKLRGGLLAFAGLLGALSIWQLAADLKRPSGIEFTVDLQPAAAFYKQRSTAATAARIAMFRGDLWSDAAFAYGDKFLGEDLQTSSYDAGLRKQNEMMATQALLYAPYNSGLWLLLAAGYARSDLPVERTAAALKMSYYTGSDRIELVQTRIFLAVRSQALRDEELQELVRHDIRMALAKGGTLLSAVLLAYDNAPPFGKEFIKKTVAALGSNLLEERETGVKNKN